MPQKIKDLDVFLKTPIKVRLAGEVYKVPADIPAPLFLQLTAFADSDESEADIARVIYDELLALFQVYQPKLERLPMGLAQLTAAIPQIYGGDDDGPPPKPARKPSTRSTSRRKKRASSS